MKRTPNWLLALVGALFLANGVAMFATCGGGGGGGAGGASAGGVARPSGKPEVYRVPWTMHESGALPVKPDTALVVLWFPASLEAAGASPMLTSRALTQASARGVATVLVRPEGEAERKKYGVGAEEQAAVLANPDGSEITRLAAAGFDPAAVDKLVSKEINDREKTAKALLDAAEKRAKSGDQSALSDLQAVWAQRAMFPSLGKRAAKALQKLGVKVGWNELELLGPDSLADPDINGLNNQVEELLRLGLDAELVANYEEARRLYERAVEVDPSDATALRFLGEFYRHHTGEWNKAGRIFRRIVAMPADPIARAVALHGLGKMTIHAGRYSAGLKLFEESIAAFPLPITYRNLAVFWFSEKEGEKAAGYMRQALALAPHDAYNQVFAAVYLAAAGKLDEAVKIAEANHGLMDASYNLAAIWAQAGDRKKAMEYLRRHFHEYERYEAVRAMEMKEAREDWMFANLYSVKDFDLLTQGAKNAWMIGPEWCDPSQLTPVLGPPGPRTMR
jgi:tetratricopeptide (TPR) repeat protein